MKNRFIKPLTSGLALTLLCSIAYTAFGAENIQKKYKDKDLKTIIEAYDKEYLKDMDTELKKPIEEIEKECLQKPEGENLDKTVLNTLEELMIQKCVTGLTTGFATESDKEEFEKLCLRDHNQNTMLKQYLEYFEEEEQLKQNYLESFEEDPKQPTQSAPKPENSCHPLRLLPNPIKIHSLKYELGSAFGFSPDGTKIAISTPEELKIYDVQSGKLDREENFKLHPEERFGDSGYLIFGDNRIISVYGKWLRTFSLKENEQHSSQIREYKANILNVSYHSQKDTLTTVTSEGDVDIWDLNSQQTSSTQRLQLPDTTGSDTTPQLSSNRKYLVTSKDKTLLICDLNNPIFANNNKTTWNKKIDLLKKINTLAFSPDGKFLAVGATDSVYVYNTENFDRGYKIDLPLASYPRSLVNQLVFSPDRRFIKIMATGLLNEKTSVKCPYIFDRLTKKLKLMPPEKNPINTVFSNDSQFYAEAGFKLDSHNALAKRGA